MNILYGVGVGPGDPELLTLKGVRIIKESDILILPSSGKKNVAYEIARQVVENLEEKNILEVEMPMVKDKKILKEAHEKAASQIIDLLDRGKQVCFLTLGDPTIYSTYAYVHKIVLEKGRKAQMIPGVPSFCAVASTLNESLTEGKDTLTVIPASYEGAKEEIKRPGTKILMKAGKSLGEIKETLIEQDNIKVSMVENCGMEGEKIYRGIHEMEEKSGYFSIVVVKEERGERDD